MDRGEEAGEKVHGTQHPQTDPITTLGTIKGPAGHWTPLEMSTAEERDRQCRHGVRELWHQIMGLT